MVDEPTSELTGEVLKFFRALSLEHMTMIVVTHEMAFARDVADRIIFIDQGSIVEEGDAEELFENTIHERTRSFIKGFSEG